MLRRAGGAIAVFGVILLLFGAAVFGVVIHKSTRTRTTPSASGRGAPGQQSSPTTAVTNEPTTAPVTVPANAPASTASPGTTATTSIPGGAVAPSTTAPSPTAPASGAPGPATPGPGAGTSPGGLARTGGPPTDIPALVMLIGALALAAVSIRARHAG